ncbi:polyprenol reductase 2-like protein, partial [Tanacetum coccineum]
GSLREKTEKLEEYVIPYGDWFEYVSSPHYSAEIVIYGGLLVASGGADLSLWLLFAFVVANLVFAATETQRCFVLVSVIAGYYSNSELVMHALLYTDCKLWNKISERLVHIVDLEVMYVGLLVACGGADLSLWLLFTVVVANLGFAATITHRWYRHKFDDYYPRNRWAILPFAY